MKRLLALAWVALALLIAGCGRTLAPIPPASTPSPIVLATAPPDAWTVLQQVPLQIPTLAQGEACPVVPGSQVTPDLGDALGGGPAYLVGFGKQGVINLIQANQQNGEYALLVLLTVPPGYADILLVRGRQMDGSGSLTFSMAPGSEPLGQWQLSPDTAGATGVTAGNWLTWSAYLVIGGSGCYGLQVDGTGFSEMLVFQAIKVA